VVGLQSVELKQLLLMLHVVPLNLPCIRLPQRIQSLQVWALHALVRSAAMYRTEKVRGRDPEMLWGRSRWARYPKVMLVG
jgi:hypothetical protein